MDLTTKKCCDIPAIEQTSVKKNINHESLTNTENNTTLSEIVLLEYDITENLTCDETCDDDTLNISSTSVTPKLFKDVNEFKFVKLDGTNDIQPVVLSDTYEENESIEVFTYW